ncbi:uncharacterized protein KY384_004671 [Bacidia gigantensis]|uniref:uncharacterized protein n=1 Tax=Bacidia gigantensis TaxID=2732470 RepID=UPI001D049EC4|nr:uncharacterized protein KY384_004671 [Bacidia gigantensis]KAG8530633.1 hypothetical protein KY384_004671 [Bacidia gigantensis]
MDRSPSRDTEVELPYSSPPFEFVVENEAFFLHQTLVAQTSAPLNALINIDMKEKDEGQAALPGVEAATFRRFCQWAYTGSYDCPAPCPVSKKKEGDASNASIVAQEAASVDGESESRDQSLRKASGKSEKKKPKNTRWTPSGLSRSSLHERFLRYWESREPQTVPQKKPNVECDYTEVFLAHAKLYVFAEEKDVPRLKTRALKGLHTNLCEFHLQRSRVGDFVSLLRYAYENTAQLRPEKPDDLRQLLAEYMSWQMEILMKNEEFRSLAFTVKKDGNEFLDDFMAMVMKRLYKADISSY